MDPANKLLLAVGGVVVLAIAGVSTWLIIRARRTGRAQAEHARIMKERAQQPETPPRRPTSASESSPNSSESRPSTSAPSASTSSASTSSTATSSEPETHDETVSTSEPAANGPTAEPLRVIVGENRKKWHPVPPGAVIELKPPPVRGHAVFRSSREDVSVHVVDVRPDLVLLTLDGPGNGQLKLVCFDVHESGRSQRVAQSWKLDRLAA